MTETIAKIRRVPSALALAVLLGAVALPAQTPANGHEPPAGAESARSSARDELRQAGRLVARVKGTRGDERVAALEHAARAYREVIARHPGDRATCARAWFEIGELERRKSDLAAAERAYAQAESLDPERFGARAAIQRAHMQRRLERADEALATYRRVVELEPEGGRAHTARIWIARTLQEQGDLTAAIETYENALDTTGNPRRVIDLCNRLARTLLAQGDLDGAAEALSRAEAVVPAGDGEEAARLRRAVEKMSARRALQRARDKANGAHEDARRLEKERKGGK